MIDSGRGQTPLSRARLRAAAALLAFAANCPWPRAASALEPFPGTVPGTEIGSGLNANFEPSGAAWHPRLQQLFLCGDDGTIARANRDGTGTTNWSLAGNWEGLAVADLATDFVYVVNENTGHIREFNFVTGLPGRDFDLTTAVAAPGVSPLTAADLAAFIGTVDNKGIEALTFVPDADDPEGGLFLAGSQENGTIYRFRLSLSAGATAVYAGKFKTWPASDNDLSGLEYDRLRGLLLAVWDGSNVIRAMTTTGTVVHEWSIPAGSNDEEGLGYDGQSLFIARDPAATSEVWRYDGFSYSTALDLLPQRFYGVAPCRVIDTRAVNGAHGGPALAPGPSQRVFTLAGSCAVPLDAKALSVNITVTGGAAGGQLRLVPGNTSGGSVPGIASISFAAGRTRANNLVAALASDGSGTVLIQNDAPGAVHFILDVNGYFR